MCKTDISKSIEIKGVVQGVGFRPFLFNLAREHHISGRVKNTADGVALKIQGRPADVDLFCRQLPEKRPPLSIISSIRIDDAAPQDFKTFKIERSLAAGPPNTLISPDVSICEDCLREMQDPLDRRFEYPFINCTNCGPRFTIIEDIPYDRPGTSMKHFQMCGPCLEEYENPLDRRFHAQPNACPDCGPHLFLVDRNGDPAAAEGPASLEAAAGLLTKGKILGIKGLGGFHLACDASNKNAVAELRIRKQRPDKPFALMAENFDAVRKWVFLSPAEEDMLSSHHRPIVLLRKKNMPDIDTALIEQVSPENACLGIMLPYTPMHFLLLQKGPQLLVMTSGNRSGDPLSIDNQDAVNAFSHIADYFLLHNRDIYFRADDSIVRWQADRPRFIRRSRGYAPLPIPVAQSLPRILACGAGLKNTVCLTRGTDVFLSQHIGDLESVKSHEYFRQCIRHLKNILDVEPEIIAHDLHPGYMSTAFAQKSPIPVKYPVQHHHAHAVSCMAENGLDETVIAVTLDGTGLGTDGHIWGGEILVCDRAGFQRLGHLKYVPMPGGDKAAVQPWRMAVAFLHAAYGKDLFSLKLPPCAETAPAVLNTVVQMIEKGLNCPLTSSAGRLFDAVASITGLCQNMTHESQAAMTLEAAALRTGETAYEINGDVYDFDMDPDGQIDMTPCIRQIAGEAIQKTPAGIISRTFHRTLARAFSQAADDAGVKHGLKKIVLSGGVFHNDLILSHMIQSLEKKGFSVYTHSKVPAGDGGICLGQALAAAAMEEKNKWD